MERLADAITSHIKNNNSKLDNTKLLTINYGLKSIFNELSKFFLYFVIFMLFGLTKELMVSIIFFCLIRAFAGGYHASKYWQCFFLSLVIFSIAVFSGIYLPLTFDVQISLVVFSLIITAILAPIDHPNKPIISAKRRSKLKYISIAAIFIMSFFAFLLPEKMTNVALLSITIQGITLLIGHIYNSKKFTDI